MNPMLSLSFLSSGPVAAGAEPVAKQAGFAVEAGADNKFGRLLHQSGEQQQVADRQSFAGFNIADKSKRLASIDGQPAGLSQAEELSLTDGLSQAEENKAVALLGLLDLASQTRLQLTTQDGEQGQATANTNPADTEEITASNKLNKGEWFILPVEPDLAAAASETDKTAVDLLASLSKDSDAPVEPGKQTAVAATQALSESADREQAASAKAAEPSVTKLEPLAAVAEADAELVMQQQAVQQQVGASNGGVQPPQAVELKAAASAELLAATSTVSSTAPVAQQATDMGSNPPLAGATLLTKPEHAAVTTAEGSPGSNLASAAAVAELVLAKQQRAGMADAINQSKQALTDGAGSVDTTAKVEAAVVAGSLRAESSLSGFGSILNQASQSEGAALAGRLEAATIAGAQQSAERAKTQSGHTAVTEQLKQVNLLAQNATGQLRERINLMVRQNIQVAEIRLDPAELGQMQIRVNMQQDQASIQFIVQQQHAKELLEQQMPRLREMLQQQGIQLGEGQVQQQRHGDSQANGQRNGQSGAGQGGGEQTADEQVTAVQLDVKLSERLVDDYA